MASDERAAAILALSVGQLASAIARGDYTAVEVLKAFRARAEVINEACNAVTYWIEDSEEAARRADEHLQTTGCPLGPLHGVPFTIKDHLQAKNTVVTMGLLTTRKHVETPRPGRGLRKEKEDEPLVAVLRSLGAIPFAKTTMTQMGETWGGGSAAFGDTLNPWDTLRTTGGSSSGEGALVGGGASPFGIGSDVGGSLRIPASFCGIATLKPTIGRLAQLFLTPGDYSIAATQGFMAKSVEDVALLYSWALSPRLFDQLPRLARIPFHHSEFASDRKLRIGYFTEEYTTPKPCPTAVRAMEAAIEALRRAGHELVPFRPDSEGVVTREQLRAADWSFQVSRRPPRRAEAEGAKEGASRARPRPLPSWVPADEPVHPDLVAIYSPAHPNMKTQGVEFVGNEGVLGYLRLMERRDALRARFQAYWRRAGLDALVCPAWALPACHVEEVRTLSKIVETTRVWNFLDLPAGTVPVAQVTEADLRQPYEPSHPDPEVNRAARRCLEGAEGLPVSVQVVAMPWREELALRVMREVQAGCPFGVARAALQPLPRRSPTLGARPEPVSPPGSAARAKL